MTQNAILDELRQAREQLLEEAGGTLAGLVAQLQQDERQSGRLVLQLEDLPRHRRIDARDESAENVVSGGTPTPVAR
jgi:hypothetical protein